MKILLDYFFPISTTSPTPAASTAFLKQVCLVVKPKAGVQAGAPELCVSTTEVAAITDNVDATQIFAAGLSRVYIMPADDLNLAAQLAAFGSLFFTVLISSDFVKADIESAAASLVKANLTFTAKDPGSDGNDISIEFLDTGSAGAEVVTVTDKKISVSMEGGVSTAAQLKAAIDAEADAMELIDAVTVEGGEEATAQAAFAEDFLEGGALLELGTFKGVTGVWSDDDAFLATQAAIENRVAFHSTTGNKAKNMAYAFGKLLSNSLNWLNQQFITMPATDDVDALGECETLFDSKISFSLSDDEYGQRLGLFAAGGKAIVAPYIKRNLEIDLQSEALSYVSANQPQYTKTQAALMEDELQKVVDSYVTRKWIESGSAEVKLEQSNFVASGYFEIKEPTALWRILGQITQV